MNVRALLFVTLVGTLATGCSFGSPAGAEAPAPIHLKVEAGARLNPDEYGNSLPTAVRVYQLKSTAKVASAELAPLLRDPKEVLGEDYLAVEEVFLEPKGSAEKVISREKDTRAVMVVGVFRRPTGDSWRVVLELPKGGKATLLDVVLDEYRIAAR